MVDKNWTVKQAYAAQVEAVGGGLSTSSPEGPFWQWDAMHRLDRLASDYDHKPDSLTLFLALRICANHDLPMPKWLATQFIRRFDKVLNCDLDSWDAAFGKPYPGKHIESLRNKRKKRFQVWRRIQELLKSTTRERLTNGCLNKSARSSTLVSIFVPISTMRRNV